MRKIILTMTLTLMLSAPVLAVPVMMELMAVEQIDSEVTMVVEGNTVTVNGAEGLVLEIISLTGRKVAQYEINSPSQRIELNLTKGCYVEGVENMVAME